MFSDPNIPESEKKLAFFMLFIPIIGLLLYLFECFNSYKFDKVNHSENTTITEVRVFDSIYIRYKYKHEDVKQSEFPSYFKKQEYYDAFYKLKENNTLYNKASYLIVPSNKGYFLINGYYISDQEQQMYRIQSEFLIDSDYLCETKTLEKETCHKIIDLLPY